MRDNDDGKTVAGYLITFQCSTCQSSDDRLSVCLNSFRSSCSWRWRACRRKSEGREVDSTFVAKHHSLTFDVRLDVLQKKMKEMDLNEEDYWWYMDLRK